ncbi:MAG TPA: ADP-ribosylglycohydrolase family protein [Nostocaceae cyanobacterium]|nr:ADP-ribosylglycohydrolase family protein [Nostocaceae cyanobacterium]
MRYSLVNRFRGAFLGAFLGESVAKSQLADQNTSYCDLGKLAVSGTESLIRFGRLDIHDWVERQQLAGNHDDWGKIILATLPLCLFFHENPTQLKQNLQQVLKIWGQDHPALQDAILAFGYAIAKSLTEQLSPHLLIPQIITFLDNRTNPIAQNLLKVNTLFEQSASLAIVQTQLNSSEQISTDFALAFYCFLSTLEDFQLAVLRASYSAEENQTSFVKRESIAAITGTLSGVYNSTAGMPINWQVLFSPKNSPAWGLNNFSQMLELSDALVAVWSGVYELSLNQNYTTTTGKPLSFAAPCVIRPR